MHRIGPETWAFVPPEVVHAFEVTGDAQARFLVFHAPGSGYGDYVRGAAATFDQLSPLGRRSHATPASPSSAVREARRETRSPIGRSGVRPCSSRPTSSRSPSSTTDPASAARRRTSTASTRTRSSSSKASSRSTCATARTTLPAGTLLVFPPDVVHGFDNDSGGHTRALNFHMPSSGFADYMRGRNPDFDQFDPPEDGASTRRRSAPLGVGSRRDLGGARRRRHRRHPLHESKMFGMPCLKRENGKVVAGHWKDGGLTVKLTDAHASSARAGASRSTPAWDE